MTTEAITLVKDAIHNPAEPRHFMRFKPVTRQIRVLRGDTVLAESTHAMRLNEVGRDIYDSVVYLPRQDCSAALRPLADKSTHCPLKGDASYFTLDGNQPVAWTYDRPLATTDFLRDYIAFYGDQVTVIETAIN
tara:strand:+ start:192 stop:593 length:402 start_codon:yes stop_codon:yes gene_type:complete